MTRVACTTCEAIYQQVCPTCDDQDGLPTNCWRCGGDGLVPEYDEDLPALIVHEDFCEGP